MKATTFVVSLVAVIIFVTLVLTVFAYAASPEATHDHSTPLGQWYKSLVSPQYGTSCCSAADCAPAKARVYDGHYQVWNEGRWLPVPDEVILPQMENPVGEPVACIFYGEVRCLVRGPEG